MMTPISSGELTATRDVAEDHLPDLATIKRATEVADGRGGQTQIWATVASNVKCRVMIVRSVANVLGQLAAKEAEMATHLITFPAGTDVSDKDQVEVGSRIFRVKFVEKRSLEVTRRALCVEI